MLAAARAAEQGIEPDVIGGTSIGAIMATLAASDQPLSQGGGSTVTGSSSGGGSRSSPSRARMRRR